MLLLLLTGCQTAPTDNDQTLSSTPSSGDVTPPSSSVPATSVPEVDVHDGRAFITRDEPSVVLPPYWVPPAECLVDHLYWVIKSTKECILICDEPIYSRSYTTTDTHVYFVKESEPTKIYRTLIGDFVNHQLVYESAYGKVTYMTFISKLDCLQFVANEKKFVQLDMSSGESTVLMEQYYIEFAYLEAVPLQDDIELREWIWFSGKPTEDAPQGDYFYYWKTGEVELDTYL